MNKPSSPVNPPRTTPLPGMAVIALWMLALAVLGVTGVFTHRYPNRNAEIFVLVLSTLFAVAGLGLIRRKRWGWALSLGATFLSMTFAFYTLFHAPAGSWIVMALTNLVFFLYLIRGEVLERLD
jgi:uncharacterized membrane protein (DUF2068 family)